MINIKFDVRLGDADKANLGLILGSNSDAELADKLAKVAHAGIQEHIDMFLGSGVYSRGSDFKERRLAMLSLYLFDNTIPDEGRVARMFQLTRTGARALLRAMLSKYQILLTAPLNATLKSLLSSAVARGQDKHSLTCASPALIQNLNDKLK